MAFATQCARQAWCCCCKPQSVQPCRTPPGQRGRWWYHRSSTANGLKGVPRNHLIPRHERAYSKPVDSFYLVNDPTVCLLIGPRRLHDGDMCAWNNCTH